MDTWKQTALRLDDLYSERPQIARKQLKNQTLLLVLENTRHKFFPVRRLADGRLGKSMDLPESQAQEGHRYKHELETEGFLVVRVDEQQHETLLAQLSGLLEALFDTTTSVPEKTFWVQKNDVQSKVFNAFQAYDNHGLPDGFREARTWFVAHPKTGASYPAKVIWGLATDQKGGQFTSHIARDGLRRAGFECADLSGCPPIDHSNDQRFYEGGERQITQSTRERSAVARVLCIEHYRSLNDGRLACLVCDVDFSEVYGSIGEGFIHVHHLNPLAEAKDTRLVSPEFDLAPVCPNCHAMIHRGSITRSIAEMRRILGMDQVG